MLPRPKQTLIVSVHRGQVPLTVGATYDRVALTCDFWGSPDSCYQTTDDAPGAGSGLRIVAMTPDGQATRTTCSIWARAWVSCATDGVPIIGFGFTTYGLPFLTNTVPTR